MNTELKMPKYITLTEKLNENNANEVLKNGPINESLPHFTLRQKKVIKGIIKKRYDMLKNLSK